MPGGARLTGVVAPREILPGLYFFERGYLNGNHLAAAGEVPTLVDTGYASGLAATLQNLAAVGIEPAAVRTLVNTHLHCDHVGGNPALQGASGCRAWLHRAARPAVENGDRRATWWDYYGQAGEFFPVGRWLEDGEEVLLGVHPFQVVHVPGHAPDLIALYHPGEKLLLSSDALWERGLAVVTPEVEGDDAPRRWLDSLERLSGLDVDRVYPGHGAPFGDFVGALEQTRSRLELYCADPHTMADDLLRKITVYTLLMRGHRPEAGFFDQLCATRWFPATVDRWFEGDYRAKYDETLDHLLQRRAVVRDMGRLRTLVRP